MAPNHKVVQSFDHVVLQGHLTNINPYISTTKALMATQSDKMMTDLDELVYKVTLTFDHVVLQGHVTKESHYMSTTRVSVTTKLDTL